MSKLTNEELNTLNNIIENLKKKIKTNEEHAKLYKSKNYIEKAKNFQRVADDCSKKLEHMKKIREVVLLK